MINLKLQFQKKIEDIEKEVLKKAVASVEVTAVDSIKKNFEAEGRPGWKPSMKKKKRPGSKTLTESGALSDVLSDSDMTKGTVELATNPLTLPYARIHQEGGTFYRKGGTRKMEARAGKGSRFVSGKRKKGYKEVSIGVHKVVMPQRKFLIIPEEDIPGILQKIKESIK